MREDYQAFTIGRRFRITPPAAIPPTEGRFNLIMDRGAFGSGEHETTRSCIELLETLPVTEYQRILDLGSGTGILTIAALLLNPDARSLCVDIDPLAVESCARNCDTNGVGDQVSHRCGTLDAVEEHSFDLILANIYGDILLDVAQPLVEKARSQSFILLSGILWEYNFDVKQKYEKLGCKLIKSLLMDEFCTLLLQKE